MIARQAGLALVAILICASSVAQSFVPVGRTFNYPSDRRGVSFGGGGPDAEEGTYRGVSYRFYYEDGSGFVGDWTAKCESDAMTDKRICWVQRGDLWVYATGGKSGVVSIGDNHFPGSNVYLRIDQGKPTSTPSRNDGDFSKESSARLINKLKSGGSATTRYMEWPYKEWVDGEIPLEHFSEAWDYIVWAVNSNKGK